MVLITFLSGGQEAIPYTNTEVNVPAYFYYSVVLYLYDTYRINFQTLSQAATLMTDDCIIIHTSYFLSSVKQYLLQKQKLVIEVIFNDV